MPHYRFGIGKASSGSEETRQPYFTKLFSCHSRRVFEDRDEMTYTRRQPTFDLQRSLCSEPTTTEQPRRRKSKLQIRSLHSSCSLKPSIPPDSSYSLKRSIPPSSSCSFKPYRPTSPSPPLSYKPSTTELSRPSSASPISFHPPSRRGSRQAVRHLRSQSNVSTDTTIPRSQPPIPKTSSDRWPIRENEEQCLKDLTDEMGAWLSSLAESSSKARARHLAGLSPLPPVEQDQARQKVGWDLEARRQSSSSILVTPRTCTSETEIGGE